MNERIVQVNGKWQVVKETRTPEQIAADREAATIAFKERYNAEWYKRHPASR